MRHPIALALLLLGSPHSGLAGQEFSDPDARPKKKTRKNKHRLAFHAIETTGPMSRCHTAAARRDPKTSGAIHFALRIGKGGTVDKFATGILRCPQVTQRSGRFIISHPSCVTLGGRMRHSPG